MTLAFNADLAAQDSDISVVTLSECWRYRSSELLSLRPAIDTSNLYVAENGGRISAISLSSGTRIWSTELGGDIRSNIAVEGSNVYAVASDSSRHMRLRGLSVTSGIPNLDVEVPYGESARLIATHGKVIIGSASGFVASFPVGAAKPEWQTMIPGIDLSTLAVISEKGLAVSADKTVHAISTVDGKETFTITADGPVSTLSLFDGDVLVGDSRGRLTRYDDDGRTVAWRLRNGARISGVVPTEHGLLVSSLDNFVYMVSSYYGSIKWKKRMSGRVSSLAANGDLAAVITVGEPNAVLVNLENGKSAGEYVVGEDDAFTQPAIAANGQFIFFTSTKVVAESPGTCSAK
jgi:outer membrane protein assembly factor BamB